MLKWLRSIDWAPIFGSALVLVVALWVLSAYPNNEADPTAYQNPFERIICWLSPEGWTALFTAALFFSTLALWSVTRTAAYAAKDAAEALPVVERAYVYPVVVSEVGMATYIKESKIYFLGDKRDTPRPETCDIAFKIKNYGKTPAILKSVSAGLEVWPVTTEIFLPMPEGTLGAMDITSDFTAAMMTGLTQNRAQHILAYEAFLSFCGTIVFVDIWGNENTTKFHFAWDPGIERMALRDIETTTKKKNT